MQLSMLMPHKTNLCTCWIYTHFLSGILNYFCILWNKNIIWLPTTELHSYWDMHKRINLLSKIPMGFSFFFHFIFQQMSLIRFVFIPWWWYWQFDDKREHYLHVAKTQICVYYSLSQIWVNSVKFNVINKYI